ncbi:thioesterase family protein [Aspergillus fijiensis CBS 313.89]|uniref:Capsule polysaccharide biosynthesis protein n=1 Tax=Aspergillus fijiensis CBS 313.89 TaxID=1448319 RepID=A0A8G1RDW7_9EURO|nr:uncharacterized protein BO72DRAFT_441976 [Aspergillus fijiensis CBS 313.89]RAK71484.1 hypothetical protein BO72DRAFT_441976 [Aspergillus fijiensis CBS 313.89]
MFSISPVTVLLSAVVGFFLFDPKALPGLWHARIFTILVRHLVWNRNRALISTPTPSTIFRPLRTRSYCSLAEIDFNLHKSNSTFYADLDVSRIELLVALFKDAITPLSPRRTLASSSPYSRRHRRGPLIAALGGVACIFRREIKPYQRYEVVSRVLTWDDKWLYIVSYFVKPGGRHATAEIPETQILASAMSKYVFKKGRQTMEPDGVLRNLGLLAESDEAIPAAAAAPAPAPAPAPAAESLSSTPALPQQDLRDHAGATSGAKQAVDRWSWAHVESERQRGLVVAAHMAGLTGLQELGVSTLGMQQG